MSLLASSELGSHWAGGAEAEMMGTAVWRQHQLVRQMLLTLLLVHHRCGRLELSWLCGKSLSNPVEVEELTILGHSVGSGTWRLSPNVEAWN